jgi:hypothetical protein
MGIVMSMKGKTMINNADSEYKRGVNEGFNEGQANERAKIVAWLRAQSAGSDKRFCYPSVALLHLTTDIEIGIHDKENE